MATLEQAKRDAKASMHKNAEMDEATKELERQLAELREGTKKLKKAVAVVPDDREAGDAYLFLSDTDAPKDAKDYIKDLLSWEAKKCTNVPCDKIRENAQNLWVNLKKDGAVAWAAKALSANTSFKVYLVYGGTKLGKWIKDLERFHKGRVLRMSQLKSYKDNLGWDDVVESLDNVVMIHKPPSCLGRVFGCGTREKSG